MRTMKFCQHNDGARFDRVAPQPYYLPMMRSFYVVTPSLNQSALLEQCIASVADQAGVRVHHHVQDAVSTDGTVPFLEHYKQHVDASRESKESYSFSYESVPDSGMYDAVNCGWRRSEGAYDIYAYLNCDEQYLKGALSAVADRFESRPALDVVFGNVLVIAPDGDLICRRDVVAPSKYLILTDHLPIYTAATFVRGATLFSNQLFFDPKWKVIGDAEWALRLFDLNPAFEIMKDYLSTFVFSRNNLSLSPAAKTETDKLRARAPRLARHLSKPIKLCHWLRKARAGAYFPKTVSYDIYVTGHSQRTHFTVRGANNLWWERLRDPT